MKIGYLIIISSQDDIDYLKLAYAAALSIKNTQKPGYDLVALVTDKPDEVKNLKSPWVFDKVIEWSDKSGWDGRSHMDQLSPWDFTICIDADMLFLRDYSHWFDYFIANCDLYIPKKVYTISGDVVVDNFYRETFIKNNLPNLYSMYTFFKKDKYKEFFELNRIIIDNQQEYKNLFLSEYKPKIIGTDEAFSLAAKILDIVDEISYDLDFPKIVHMKPMIQDWPWPADKVTDHAGFYFNSQGQLKIGNYRQDSLIHYVEKNLITDEIVSLLEEIAWQKK